MPGDSLVGLAAGIAMFLITATGYVLRKHGHKRAAHDLPKLASELGLLFVPSRYAGALGQLKGSYQGYEVRLDPEESRSISVRFARSPQLDLRSYASPFAPPFGWVAASSGDRAFDRFFKTRFASAALARSLATSSRPSGYLEPFQATYAKLVKGLTVSADGLRCELDLGNPPHLPSSAIRELLPACVALARFIESHASDSPTDQPAVQLAEVWRDAGMT